MPFASDHNLIHILDSALKDTAQRSGDWLVCKPGCAQCCVGVFAINQLDVVRLQQGLQDLHQKNPELARTVRTRARESVERLTPDFPGDAGTGILETSEDAETRFAEFANDEPCPALDPATQMCDLYLARPMTCRVFGPPVRSVEGLGVCELCYHGASEEQIAACEMIVDPDDLEANLLKEWERSSGTHGSTVVAFALALTVI